MIADAIGGACGCGTPEAMVSCGVPGGAPCTKLLFKKVLWALRYSSCAMVTEPIL